jgi:hypothetical protein
VSDEVDDDVSDDADNTKVNDDMTNIVRNDVNKQITTTKALPLIDTYEYMYQQVKTMCPNSYICNDLYNKSDIIKKLFDNYRNFTKTTPAINLGLTEKGCVFEFDFVDRDVKAKCALKMALLNKSDNLLYEFCMGHIYMRNIIKAFPCFIETYGIYDIEKHE